jgi:hypothetical protein
MSERRFEWLADYAFNTYSQFGEDGVLQAIFSLIGAENEWCIECGAADGLFFSNTRRLIDYGWHAILVEASRSVFQRLVKNCEGFGERVICVPAQIDADNRLETVLQRCGAPVDIDLAVIDIDGQDYYVFNSLLRFRPRVVMVEFDRTADEDFIPLLGGEGQAGSRAIAALGAGKWYTEVYRSSTNIVFVKQPLDQLLSGTREEMRQRLAED